MKLTVLIAVGALSFIGTGFAQGEVQPVPGDKVPIGVTKDIPLPKGGDGLDTGVPITKNPADYAAQEFLVVLTSTGLPRNEYYSRDGGEHLSAISRFGLKDDGSVETFGWTENKEQAAALRREFSKTKFLSIEDKNGKQLFEEYKKLLRKKGVAYTSPPAYSIKK